MRYFIFTILLVVPLLLTAQSKKEQIAAIELKMDSLSGVLLNERLDNTQKLSDKSDEIIKLSQEKSDLEKNLVQISQEKLSLELEMSLNTLSWDSSATFLNRLSSGLESLENQSFKLELAGVYLGEFSETQQKMHYGYVPLTNKGRVVSSEVLSNDFCRNGYFEILNSGELIDILSSGGVSSKHGCLHYEKTNLIPNVEFEFLKGKMLTISLNASSEEVERRDWMIVGPEFNSHRGENIMSIGIINEQQERSNLRIRYVNGEMVFAVPRSLAHRMGLVWWTENYPAILTEASEYKSYYSPKFSIRASHFLNAAETRSTMRGPEYSLFGDHIDEHNNVLLDYRIKDAIDQKKPIYLYRETDFSWLTEVEHGGLKEYIIDEEPSVYYFRLVEK
jgi:hypothetical protein